MGKQFSDMVFIKSFKNISQLRPTKFVFLVGSGDCQTDTYYGLRKKIFLWISKAPSQNPLDIFAVSLYVLTLTFTTGCQTVSCNVNSIFVVLLTFTVWE